MANEAFVDGEFESLLGMFNFDQCSSDDSSIYNDQHNAPNEIKLTSSDDFFPFYKTLHGSNHESNLFLDSTQELVKPRKKQKLSQEEGNMVSDPKTAWRYGQSISSFICSDDDRALSLATNSSNSVKGKTRQKKGIATDPQSLYARRRRERINERLKTLQSLVLNGTKVDISTMLEEAVHYVKFLQLQIKLLSSDDLWMYAALAHNGLNMGLHHNLLSRLM